MTAFTWSASGGTLGEMGDPPVKATVDGYIMADDFEGEGIDPRLWRTFAPAGTSLIQADGVLTLKVPGGTALDSAASIESVFEFRGNFAAEVTIVSVQADGLKGAGALLFRTEDGFVPHVQRIAWIADGAVQTIEANVENPDHHWQGSTTVFDQRGAAKIRLLRGGAAVGFETENGGTLTPVGPRWSGISAAPARVAIGSFAIENLPSVTAVFDNFGAAQNLGVNWVAPADAADDTFYTINLGDGCHATARIAPH